MIDDKIFYENQDLKNTNIFLFIWIGIYFSSEDEYDFKHIRHLYWFFWQVTINITDDNERPFFSQPEYHEEVEENTKLDGVLITVTAQDRKGGKIVKCNCTYRLDGVYCIYY